MPAPLMPLTPWSVAETMYARGGLYDSVGMRMPRPDAHDATDVLPGDPRAHMFRLSVPGLPMLIAGLKQHGAKNMAMWFLRTALGVLRGQYKLKPWVPLLAALWLAATFATPDGITNAAATAFIVLAFAGMDMFAQWSGKATARDAIDRMAEWTTSQDRAAHGDGVDRLEGAAYRKKEVREGVQLHVNWERKRRESESEMDTGVDAMHIKEDQLDTERVHGAPPPRWGAHSSAPGPPKPRSLERQGPPERAPSPPRVAGVAGTLGEWAAPTLAPPTLALAGRRPGEQPSAALGPPPQQRLRR